MVLPPTLEDLRKQINLVNNNLSYHSRLAPFEYSKQQGSHPAESWKI
jgi:hypothetical protein